MSENLDYKDLFIKDNYENMTTRKIADILEISNSTVVYRAKKMGISKTFVGAEEFVRKPFEIVVETEFENYSITSLGRLVNTEKNYVVKGKVSRGYIVYAIQIDKKIYYRKLHRLLAMGFVKRNDLSKDVINHRDGNKLNNNIFNLEWVTIGENNTHAHNYGLINYKTKITDEEALTIINLFNEGYSKSQVNKMCDFTTKSITEKIYNKERWKKYLSLMNWSK